MLREGSKTLPKDAQEKYFISVTHDEVNRGLLQNDKRDTQAIYFERTIDNIDEEIVTESSSNNAIASLYRDSIPIKNDAHGKSVPDVRIDIASGRNEESMSRQNEIFCYSSKHRSMGSGWSSE